MLAPERRTRADILTAVAIAALVAIATVVVVLTSGVRGTHAQSATVDLTAPSVSGPVPAQAKELWHQADAAAMRSLVVGGVAVTADGETVSGRDPRTGEQVWKYERDIPLCAVEVQFGTVIATYRDDRGCSQTTLLNAQTGTRVTARSSYMDKQVTLWPDGTYVLALGPDRLEMWRSDLVRTLEFGYVDAPVNPHTQPQRGDCKLLSAGSAPSRVAVLERCPNDNADRLSILNPAPKDSTVPEEYSSHVLNEPGGASDAARVIAVSDSRIALYVPGDKTAAPALTVYDVNGNLLATHQLSGPLAPDAMVARLSTGFFVFTGENLIALNPTSLDPLWGAQHVLGTPAIMAGQLIVPVADGLATLDPNTGAQVGRIPVQRSDYHNEPISLAVSGAMFLERRGGQVYGVGAPTS
ncbi:PQQ-binding-like beta-propeller repeat protein [Nocardia sp. ET3-3]|uniref:PQQ-binding-like beta-propeller repeat protein n=1 Tax=Nocardia terrae TaxID=2675851 RepID=A0A7K1V3K8_9NOCA|nr:PQQ-binding-like beta-propeller repeat protein [Nocardia terrae]